MNIRNLEKYILSKPYAKKNVIKKFKQLRFTVADYPFLFITLSPNNNILLTICGDTKSIFMQRNEYPQSITPSKKLDTNKWNTFVFDNSIPYDYILSAINSAYKFQLSNMPHSYQPGSY